MAPTQLEVMVGESGSAVVRAVVRLVAEHLASALPSDYGEDAEPTEAFASLVRMLLEQLEVPLVRRRLAELIREELDR